MADNQRTRYTGRDAPFLSDGDPLAELARIAGFDQPQDDAVEAHSTSADEADASAFDLEAELMRSIGLEEAPDITPEPVEAAHADRQETEHLSEEEIPAFLKARPPRAEPEEIAAFQGTPPSAVEEPVVEMPASDRSPDESAFSEKFQPVLGPDSQADADSAAHAELATEQLLDSESETVAEADDVAAPEPAFADEEPAAIEPAEHVTFEADSSDVEEFDATDEAQLNDEILRSFDEDLETASLDVEAAPALSPAPLPALAAFAQPAETGTLTDFSALDGSDDDAVWREMVRYALPQEAPQSAAALPVEGEREHGDADLPVAEASGDAPLSEQPAAAAVAPTPVFADDPWDIADELEAAFADYGAPRAAAVAEPDAEEISPDIAFAPSSIADEPADNEGTGSFVHDAPDVLESAPMDASGFVTEPPAEPDTNPVQAVELAEDAESELWQADEDEVELSAVEPEPELETQQEPEIELDLSALGDFDFGESSDHRTDPIIEEFEPTDLDPSAEDLAFDGSVEERPAQPAMSMDPAFADIDPVSADEPSFEGGQDISFDFSDFEFELQDAGPTDPVPAEHASVVEPIAEASATEQEVEEPAQSAEPMPLPAPALAGAVTAAAAPALASLWGKRISEPSAPRIEPVRSDLSRSEPARVEPPRSEPPRSEPLSFEAAIASRPKPVRQEPAAPAVLPFDFHDVADTSDVIEAVRDIEVPDLPEDEELPRADTSDDFDLSGLEAEFADILARNETSDPAETPSEQRISSAVVLPLAAARPDAARTVPEQIDFKDFDFSQSGRTGRHEPESETDRDIDDISFADLEQGARAKGAVAPTAGRRPLWVTGAAALAIIAAAGLAAYAFIGGPGGIDGEPRIIAASDEPIKVAPEDPGGRTVPNQDQAVYGQVDGSGAGGEDINLISRAEEPVDVVQRTVDPNVLPLEGRPFSGGAPEDDMDVMDAMDADVAGLSGENAMMPGAVDDDDPLGVAPRMVRTSVVRADGTLVPAAPVDLTAAADVPAVGADAQLPGDEAEGIASISDQAALDATRLIAAAGANGGLTDGSTQVPADQAAAAADEGAASPAPGVPLPQPRPEGAVAPAAVSDERLQAATPQASVELAAPVRTVQTTTFSNPAQPTPGDRPADQPVTIVGQTSNASGQTAPQPTAPAEQPVQTAAVAQPTELNNPGGYVVQIASQPTQESAQSTYNSLASRYGSIIGGRQVQIQAAEIPDRGTFYRVRVAGGTREEAVALCEQYQAAGGSCFVAR